MRKELQYASVDRGTSDNEGSSTLCAQEMVIIIRSLQEKKDN